MITVSKKIHFQHGRHARKDLCDGAAPVPKAATPRVPRVSRLMALAIRFDQLLRDGLVTDQAEIARLGHVSRARLTQIMNLLHLAPDIQEDLLFLHRAPSGRASVTEKQLQPLTKISEWKKQRKMWKMRESN